MRNARSCAAVCSLIIGQGGDGPLAVHGLAMLLNMVLVLVVAALCSVALGPVASGIVAVFLYVSCLSLANLMAVYLLIRSARLHRKGRGVTWKGRVVFDDQERTDGS